MEQSYKEKYEDILARLERAKNDNDVCDERFCCVINDIIPKLAELEDEKVREDIISLVNEFWERIGSINPEYSSRSRMLAWLEKQGENHQDPYNGISFEYNGHIWGMCARDNGVDISCDKHLIKHLEKQDEQTDIANKEYWRGYREGKKEILDKYAEIEKQGEQEKDILEDAILDGNEDGLIAETIKYKKEKQGEKKPYGQRQECVYCQFNYAGECKGSCGMKRGDKKPKRTISAEAKEALFDYENANIKQKDFAPNDEQKPAEQQMYWTEEEIEPIISDYLCGREHYGGMIGRLCHLKPKQKQTEWSENDKAFLDDILCKLEHDLILNKDEKDWLKSLRPQNHWKPTDEQMWCLSDAIEHYNSLGYPAHKLKELLDDLKKLREGKV